MTEPSDSTDKPADPGDSPEASPPQQPAPGAYAPYDPQGYPHDRRVTHRRVIRRRAIRRGRIRGRIRHPPAPGTRHRRHSRTPDTAPPPAAAPKNGLGIAALIVGILSLPAAFTIFGGFILGVIAIVLGFIGYRRARTGEATNGGMAIGGIVLGVLGVIVSAVLIAVGVWGFNQFGGRDLMDCMQQAGSDQAAQQQCEDEFKGNLEDRFSITVTPTP